MTVKKEDKRHELYEEALWTGLFFLLTRHQSVSYNEKDTEKCPFYHSNLGKYGDAMNQAVKERDVFEAIADPTRRRLIHLLSEADELPLHEITPHFSMGRTAVSKHLTILKEARLVHDRKVGRETRYKLNVAPLQEVENWVSFYRKFWSNNMMRLGRLLEEDEE